MLVYLNMKFIIAGNDKKISHIKGVWVLLEKLQSNIRFLLNVHCYILLTAINPIQSIGQLGILRKLKLSLRDHFRRKSSFRNLIHYLKFSLSTHFNNPCTINQHIIIMFSCQ